MFVLIHSSARTNGALLLLSTIFQKKKKKEKKKKLNKRRAARCVIVSFSFSFSLSLSSFLMLIPIVFYGCVFLGIAIVHKNRTRELEANQRLAPIFIQSSLPSSAGSMEEKGKKRKKIPNPRGFPLVVATTAAMGWFYSEEPEISSFFFLCFSLFSFFFFCFWLGFVFCSVRPDPRKEEKEKEDRGGG